MIKMGFCLHRPSVVDLLAVVERLFWPLGVTVKWPLLLWRGDRCREVKIRVNEWTVRWDQKSGLSREVAVNGGSTVLYLPGLMNIICVRCFCLVR